MTSFGPSQDSTYFANHHPSLTRNENPEDEDESSQMEEEGGLEEDEEDPVETDDSSLMLRHPGGRKRHHKSYHARSSTLPKPLKGILKNANSAKPVNVMSSTLSIPAAAQGDWPAVQPPPEMLPLNVMHCHPAAGLIQPPPVPPPVDVVPFDTVPPCDDCMQRARYQGSYGSECRGTSGTDCALSTHPNTPNHSNQSTLKRNSSIKRTPMAPMAVVATVSEPDPEETSEVVETVESSV